MNRRGADRVAPRRAAHTRAISATRAQLSCVMLARYSACISRARGWAIRTLLADLRRRGSLPLDRD